MSHLVTPRYPPSRGFCMTVLFFFLEGVKEGIGNLYQQNFPRRKPVSTTRKPVATLSKSNHPPKMFLTPRYALDSLRPALMLLLWGQDSNFITERREKKHLWRRIKNLCALFSVGLRVSDLCDIFYTLLYFRLLYRFSILTLLPFSLS